MKSKLILTLCAVAAFMLSSTAELSSEPVITGLYGNGTLAWADAQYEGSTYKVEWASSLDGNWSDDWSTLSSIQMTNTEVAVEVPMFFRIVRTSGLLSGKYLEQRVSESVTGWMGFYELDFINATEFTRAELGGDPSPTMGYLTTGDKTFTISNGDGQGIVSEDGSVFSIVDTSQPEFHVAVKSSSHADATLAHGAYGVFEYSIVSNDYPVLRDRLFEFAGTSSLTISEGFRTEPAAYGISTSGPTVYTAPPSVDYTVSTNGVLRFKNSTYEGMISKGGKLISYRNIDDLGSTIGIGIKFGTGMDNSKFAGTYIVSTIGDGSSLITRRYIMVFDVMGGLSMEMTHNSDGALEPLKYGKFDVYDDGVAIIEGMDYGMVSEDASMFVAQYGVSAEDIAAGAEMGLVIGIRQSDTEAPPPVDD